MRVEVYDQNSEVIKIFEVIKLKAYGFLIESKELTKLFLETIFDRSKKTLLKAINKHVNKGLIQ